MSEYAAGFGPLGYFLASNRVAVCVTTTGAATKLAMSGLSDAKLHNIPAIYLVALNSTQTKDKSPLQDVSESGINIVRQIQAELGDACIVLDDIDRLGESMERAQTLLGESKPVVLAFYPDILSRPTGARVPKHVGPDQDVGSNPRVQNLQIQSYL